MSLGLELREDVGSVLPSMPSHWLPGRVV